MRPSPYSWADMPELDENGELPEHEKQRIRAEIADEQHTHDKPVTAQERT